MDQNIGSGQCFTQNCTDEKTLKLNLDLDVTLLVFDFQQLALINGHSYHYLECEDYSTQYVSRQMVSVAVCQLSESCFSSLIKSIFPQIETVYYLGKVLVQMLLFKHHVTFKKM